MGKTAGREEMLVLGQSIIQTSWWQYNNRPRVFPRFSCLTSEDKRATVTSQTLSYCNTSICHSLETALYVLSGDVKVNVVMTVSRG